MMVFILIIPSLVTAKPEERDLNEVLLKVDKKLLNDFGITDDEIIKLGKDIDVIENLIKTKEVKTKEHVNNLKNAFLHPKYYEAISSPVEYGLVKENNNSFPVTGVKKEVDLINKEGTNGLVIAKSDRPVSISACGIDGYHYIVRSQWNRSKASGNINFPWGIAITDWNGSQNEVPYVFFGIYNSTASKGGADIGLYYSKPYGKWYPFFNGYNPSIPAYEWYSVRKTASDPTNPAVSPSTVHPGISNSTQIHMVVTELANAVSVKILDRSTWTEISTTTFTVSSNYGYNTSGTNTRFNKETSLAAHCYNGTSGAYTKGTYWSNTYIYSPTLTNIWDSTQTVSAQWKPDQAKVTQFDNVINYYQDQISIEFK